jgi:endoglucanase
MLSSMRRWALYAAALLAHGFCLALPPEAVADGLRLTGVNIAGAEFGPSKMPGVHGKDYIYPDPATIDHFAAKGMNTLRLPFRWERLQRSLGGELDPDELGRIDAVVRHATTRGMHTVLDVHNYASYNVQSIGVQPIGSPSVPVNALADLWSRLAQRYIGNDHVIFGLMNEPKGLATETWLAAANAAIAAIRATGAKNLILVPGNGFTGAHSWLSGYYGTPNGEVMRAVVDPANNFVFEAHQYLDSNFSGTKPDCRNAEIGAQALVRFTEWARQNRTRGFLGEFGGGSDPICLAALEGMLQYMAQNSDVWIGWTYWAAGAWWPRDYFTSVQPLGGTDRPQTAVLIQHLAPAGAPAQ